MSDDIHTSLQKLFTEHDPLWRTDSESKLWVVQLGIFKPFTWIAEECGTGDWLLINQGNLNGWPHEWGELLELLSGDNLRAYFRPGDCAGEQWLYLLRRERFKWVGIKTIVYE